MFSSETFVGRQAGLFESVREGIVPNVVHQPGESDECNFLRLYSVQLAPLVEEGQRAPRKVVRSDGVLEASMIGGGVNEERVS